MKSYIAVDLGGTNIRARSFTAAAEQVSYASRKTGADEGPSAVIARILDTIEDVMPPDRRQAGGIVVGAPGILDVNAGIIRKAANLPGWQDIPITEMIRKHFDLPVYLANDANLAALAEWKYGAGRGHDNLIYLTISTGIGGGLISDGKLITGAKGLAGEVGHITVVEHNGPQCGCGQRGCLESVASGPAIARRAAERIARGEKSRVLDLVHGRSQDITPEVVALAASEDDPLACEIFNEAGNYIGRILASLIVTAHCGIGSSALKNLR